jgi:hypothetical protein
LQRVHLRRSGPRPGNSFLWGGSGNSSA